MSINSETKFWTAYDRLKNGDYYASRKIFEEIQNDVDDAKYQLAYLYQMGLGGDKLIDESIDLYKYLAYKGNLEAAYDLASLCLRQKKMLEAIEFFKISSEGGNSSASYWLSEIYSGYNKFQIDASLYLVYLELAAQQGHLFAKRDLLIKKINLSNFFIERFKYRLSLLAVRAKLFKTLWKDRESQKVS